MKPKDLVEMAEFEGISRATLYRAREQLGGQIKNTEGRRSKGYAWKLNTDEDF